MFLLLAACATEPVPAPPPAAPAPAVAVPEAPVAAATPADPARSAADEAFNTAMRAHEGKAPEAPEALRAALAAYQALPEVDSDGLFHVALIQLAVEDAAGARATAERGLADHPDHLFLLDVQARAAELTGDEATTRRAYEAVSAGIGKPHADLPEYEHHARLIAKIEARATGWLAVHAP